MTWLVIAARLMAPVVVFGGLGALAGRAVPGLWYEQGPAGRTVHRVLLGQVLLVFWLYARSAVSYLSGVVVPLGAGDALVVGLILAAIATWRGGPAAAWASLRDGMAEGAVVLGVIAVAVGVSAWLELPRLVMLSSDPDQHAFMAKQLQRLGTLPWFSQGTWGTRDFQYPGGFAVLNFAWAALSGADVRDVVQVQTALHAQLALLLLLDGALLREPGRGGALRRALAGLLVIGLFYRLLPYGYQQAHYHLEGAGRTACLLLLAGGVALALCGVRCALYGEARPAVPLVTSAGYAAALLATAGLVNVVVVPWLAVLVAIGLAPSFVRAPWRARAAALTILVGAAAALLLDPYYLERFFRPGQLHSVAARIAPHPAAPLGDGLSAAVRGFVSSPRAVWLDGLSSGVFTGRAGATVIAALVGLVLLLVVRRSVTLRELVAPLLVLALVLAVRALAVPLSLALADRGRDAYLLPGYLEQAREQVVYLLAASLLATAVAGALRSRPRLATALGLAAVVAVLAVLPRPAVGAFRRQRYPGALGEATPDDLRAIAEIGRLHQAWRAAHPARVAYGSVPKVLLPNRLFRNPQENWLFPYGAARILPLYETFPVAFFYFMGSADYTYQAYLEHVCERFDVAWLRGRGIDYLFLPSDRDGVCLAGGPGLPRGARSLAVFGDAVVAEIGGEEDDGGLRTSPARGASRGLEDARRSAGR